VVSNLQLNMVCYFGDGEVVSKMMTINDQMVAFRIRKVTVS
jgi:hypothetical protein